VVIGSFARIFSHSHAPDDYERVTRVPTVIGDGARIASHAIVLGGQTVSPGEAVGSFPEDRF
jgi:acetyltransferase-like isoleucine patch superfamily enzyme